MLALGGCAAPREPIVRRASGHLPEGVDYQFRGEHVVSAEVLHFDVRYHNGSSSPKEVYLLALSSPVGEQYVSQRSIADIVGCTPALIAPHRSKTVHYEMVYRGPGPLVIGKCLVAPVGVYDDSDCVAIDTHATLVK